MNDICQAVPYTTFESAKKAANRMTERGFNKYHVEFCMICGNRWHVRRRIKD